MSTYRTAPVKTNKLPTGVPYIVANEAAERFSYYGMRTILVIFMTKYLMGADGELAAMNDQQVTYYRLDSLPYEVTPIFSLSSGKPQNQVSFGAKPIFDSYVIYFTQEF